MSRDEVDRALVGLTAAHDRVSAAMYALDTDPGLAALRRSGLTGRTAATATETLRTVGALWSQFAALGTHLGRARDLRAAAGRPNAAELRALTAILRDPLLTLDADGMVLDVPGPDPVSLPDLADLLEDSTEAVRRTVAAVSAATAAVAERFAPLSTAVQRARDTATGLGDNGGAAAALAAIEERLAVEHLAAHADPLGAAGADPAAAKRLREIGAELNRISDGLAGLAALRDDYPQRIARLARDVDAVAAAEQRTAEVYRTVLQKIANPGLPELPRTAENLRAHLRQVAEIQRDGRWPRLATELEAAERGAAAALERAGHLHEAADGLLRRRDELRGRLRAYRAKAARLGLIEDRTAAALHQSAEELLYTSPCDLPAATRAVMAYQRSLAPAPGPEPERIAPWEPPYRGESPR